ncbi:MAG: hypothetical protein V4625_03560 [Pseudomonadota bacterium]
MSFDAGYKKCEWRRGAAWANQEDQNAHVSAASQNVKLTFHLQGFGRSNPGLEGKFGLKKAIFRCQIGLQTNKDAREQLLN